LLAVLVRGAGGRMTRSLATTAWECAIDLDGHDLTRQQRLLVALAVLCGPEHMHASMAGAVIILHAQLVAIKT